MRLNRGGFFERKGEPRWDIDDKNVGEPESQLTSRKIKTVCVRDASELGERKSNEQNENGKKKLRKSVHASLVFICFVVSQQVTKSPAKYQETFHRRFLSYSAESAASWTSTYSVFWIRYATKRKRENVDFVRRRYCYFTSILLTGYTYTRTNKFSFIIRVYNETQLNKWDSFVPYDTVTFVEQHSSLRLYTYIG